MTPIKQSKLWSPQGIHNGNCFEAALASLLDLPLWMVPPFSDMYGRNDFHGRADEWLTRFFGMELEHVDGHPVETLPEFYIACGRSVRGVMHAVVYSAGKLVHDPHFSDTGIGAVQYCQKLIKCPSTA